MTKNVVLAREAEKRHADFNKWRLLQRYGPRTILDIGGNEGHFAKLARALFPSSNIVSFEPLAQCFQKLKEYLDANGPGTAIHCALGEMPGILTMNRNEFSPSSSLLPMAELHRTEFPYTAHTEHESVEVRCLDSMVDELELESPIVIKVDVQGFEDRVIKGGHAVFQNAVAVVLELSSYTLYEGQGDFATVHDQLKELGFVYRGNIDQMLSPIDRRILQFDALFENTAFL